MRLALLTALTMLAFAANSLLNRLALLDGGIGAAEFAVLRVMAGALVLVLLVAGRNRGVPALPRPDVVAVGALCAYMLGFSFAYISMDAGLGALVLFAGVQVTMFAGALREGQRPPARQWAGMAIALAGLAVLTWPGAGATAPASSIALMSIAALGWGIYSLLGRRSADPLAATCWNFVFAVPLTALALVGPALNGVTLSGAGILLACLSGGVTSALGYALWYALLPRLGASVGAITQLSVPVIALALGAALLGETVTSTMILSALMILGGIALGVLRTPTRPTQSS